jgi:hypothetical protein
MHRANVNVQTGPAFRRIITRGAIVVLELVVNSILQCCRIITEAALVIPEILMHANVSVQMVLSCRHIFTLWAMVLLELVVNSICVLSNITL